MAREPVSAIVLAGGLSRRMGRPKAFLRVGNASLIERVLAVAAEVAPEVLLVTNQPSWFRHLAVPLVRDRFSGQGPLAGVHAGLAAASHPRAVVLACDLPFVSAALLRYLVSVGEGFDAVVPVVRGYPEPLVAVYAKSCLSAIEQLLTSASPVKIADFYSQVSIRYVPEEELAPLVEVEKAFFNVNTPEDLAKAQLWEAERRKEGICPGT